jgi:D-alanine-D-alanine ligase-like ATP-grasp enzyme
VKSPRMEFMASNTDKRSPRFSHFILQVWRTGYYLKFVWDRLSNRWGTLDDPMRTNLYLQMWKSAAEKLSVQFKLLPEGFCEASFNGRTTRMYQNLLMIDYPVTIKLARSKPLVLKMLADAGISVPAYREFTLRDIATAVEFLRSRNGGACVVKPANGTAGGEGVTTNINSRRDLRRAALFASLYSSTLLIEQQVPGDSYRLLYLRGKLIDALRRKPPGIVGDGRSTVRALIIAENRRRRQVAGTAGLTWLRMDFDCRATLRSQGLTLASVVPAGKEVVVKLASNDNSSRENESVRHLICDALVQEAARAAAVVGSDLAGVDILATDPTKPLSATGGAINEVNTTPGLHYHYLINNPDKGTEVNVPILRDLLSMETHSS